GCPGTPHQPHPTAPPLAPSGYSALTERRTGIRGPHVRPLRRRAILQPGRGNRPVLQGLPALATDPATYALARVGTESCPAGLAERSWQSPARADLHQSHHIPPAIPWTERAYRPGLCATRESVPQPGPPARTR